MICPYSAADAKGLLKAAIRTDDPVVFLENELLYGQHFDVPQLDDYVLPIGKARIVRPGKDVTIVSYSIGVGVALEAAQELMGQGINAEVIDLRTLRPLDKATVLESLKRTNRMVVVEEGWPVCSISSEIIAIAMTEGFDDLDAPVLRVTDVDVPLPYAANLEKLALIKASRRGRGGEGGHLSLSAALDSDRLSVALAAACRRDVRPAFATLWNLDLAWPTWSRPSSEPALGAIRLAWWRERLEELDDGDAPPAEPRLAGGRAPAAAARGDGQRTGAARGCAGCRCSSRSRGANARRTGCRLRGRILFGIGARLLDGRCRASRRRRRAVVAGRRRAIIAATRGSRDDADATQASGWRRRLGLRAELGAAAADGACRARRA